MLKVSPWDLVLLPMLSALAANPWPFVFVALVLIAAAVLKAFRPRIVGYLGERRVVAALNRAGVRNLHDVYVPSRNGATQIDHVALAGGTILVIETKTYAGWITGDPKAPAWRQSFGRVRVTFRNPLRQNHGHVESLKAILPMGTPVAGLVVFAGEANFPRGMPEGVIPVEDVKDEVARRSKGGDRRAAAVGWAALERHLETSDRREAKRAHMGAIARYR